MEKEFKTLEKLNNITRLTDELYTAMKEIVDKLPYCRCAYIAGDATRDDSFRATISFLPPAPNQN